MRTVRLDSIVVGMDFSAPAIKGAQWASETFAPEATLTLVHVIDPPDRPRLVRHAMPTPETIEALAREDAETRMQDVAAFLTASAPRCEVRIGKPHEQIAAVAKEVRADLVVIGPHGDRPRTSKFLGTTADRIVRTSPVPVLVATTPASGRPRQILALVDDAPVTPALFAWTHDLTEAFDADVRLLHVWSNAVYSHVASMCYATAGSEAKARAEIEKDLDDASKQWLDLLAETGVERDRIVSTVTYGDAGEVALGTAASTHADLILLGRRGSGLIAPALLGSTVRTVLHGARCPVLVITEPRND